MSWNPDEWQEYCMILAAQFHGAGILQEIPDSHDGDCGLEGFSTDEAAVAYQCYVPEESAERSLTDRLIAKINGSTLQMQKKQNDLVASLAGVKIRRWYLLIPREYFRDRKVIEHAGKKRTEVVASWNLPFIANDFRIVVGYGAEFDGIAKSLADRLGLKRILFDSEIACAITTSEWEEGKSSEIQGMDQKLRKIKRPAQAIAYLRAELVRCAVIAQNSINNIRLEDPEGWEKVLLAKSEKAFSLRQESALTNLLPAQFFESLMKDFTDKLMRIMPSLAEDSARILTNYAIVEWLMACPLDFYSDQDNE
ncbi:MAG: hypothetical protein ABI162_07490 [Luteolibacter sp.]